MNGYRLAEWVLQVQCYSLLLLPPSHEGGKARDIRSPENLATSAIM